MIQGERETPWMLRCCFCDNFNYQLDTMSSHLGTTSQGEADLTELLACLWEIDLIVLVKWEVLAHCR